MQPDHRSAPAPQLDGPSFAATAAQPCPHVRPRPVTSFLRPIRSWRKWWSTLRPVVAIQLAIASATAATAPTNAANAANAKAVPRASSDANPRYERRTVHSPDGIGKFYFGREIAHVMGHQAADWLERPEREQEERTSKMLELLEITPGTVIADIGCGTGYITRPLARRTGSRGRVFAVDVQPEMLSWLTNSLAHDGTTNVVPVLGTITDPKLPADSVDLIVLVDVYHEFDHPFEMTDRMCAALKPGGRLAFVEFRGEDPSVPIKALHKMTEAQLKKEMAPHPLAWVATHRDLPWQHVVVFRKTPPAGTERP